MVVDGFHTIDFTSLFYNPIATATTTKAGCPPYVNPRLSLPAGLTDIDPSWASCEPLFYGAFDPPRVIKKAGALASPADPGAVTRAADTLTSPSPAPAAGLASPAGPASTSTKFHEFLHGPKNIFFIKELPSLPNGEPDFKLPKSRLLPQNDAPSSIRTIPPNASPTQGEDDPAKLGPTPPQQRTTESAAENQYHKAYNPLRPSIDPSEAGSGNSKAQPQHNNNDPADIDSSQSGNNPGTTLPQQIGNQKTSTEHADPQDSPQPKPEVSGAAQTSPDSNAPFVGPAPKVGDQTVYKHANGNVVVGDTTIPEGQSASVEGHEVANNPDHVVVDGQAHDVAAVPPSSEDNPSSSEDSPFVGPAPTVGGKPVQKQANGDVVVGGTTIPEGQSASVDGHEVINNSTHVSVDGVTHQVDQNATANDGPAGAPVDNNIPFVGSPPTVGGQTLYKQANGDVLVGGTTVVEGQTASINGHEIKNTPSYVAIDGTTHAIAPGSAKEGEQTPPIFDPNPVNPKDSSAASVPLPPDSPTSPDDGIQSQVANIPPKDQPGSTNSFIIGEQPGFGSPVPFQGRPASTNNAPAAGAYKSNPLFPVPTTPPSTYHIAQLQIHGLPVESAASGGLVVGSQTISLHAQTTIAGVSISVGSASVALDGTTYAMAPNPTSPTIPTSLPEDGKPFTIPIPEGENVNIGSLSSALPGATLKISPNGKEVVVEGFHLTAITADGTIPSNSAMEEVKIGDEIMHAFSPSKSTSSVASEGDSGPVFIMVPNETTPGTRGNSTISGSSKGSGKSIIASDTLTTISSGTVTTPSTQTASSAPVGGNNPSASGSAAKSAATMMVSSTKGRYYCLLIFTLINVVYLLR